jgi:hypothetical protein
LNMGQSCTFRMRFTPSFPPGLITAKVKFTDTGFNVFYYGPSTADVQGTAVRVTASAPSVTLTPTMRSVGAFGGGALQLSSPGSGNFTITTGANPVIVNALTVAAPFAAQLRGPCVIGMPIPASSTCSIDVTIAGTTAGTFTQTLTIDTNENDPSVTLNGFVKLVPTVDNNPVLSNETPFGQSAVTTFNITNPFTSAMRLTSLVLPSGPFTLQSNTCGINADIMGMSSCAVTIRFDPVGPTPACWRYQDAGCINNTLTSSAIQIGVSYFDPMLSLFVNLGSAYQLLSFSSGARPTGVVSFSAATVARGVPVAYQFALTTVADANIQLGTTTLGLPAGVVVAPVPAASTSGSCTGVTVTATPGAGTISFVGGVDNSGGAFNAAGRTCTIAANVVADTAGTYMTPAIAVGGLPVIAPNLSNAAIIPSATLVVAPGPALVPAPAAINFKTPFGSSIIRDVFIQNTSTTEVMTVTSFSTLPAPFALTTASTMPFCPTMPPVTLAPMTSCYLGVQHNGMTVGTQTANLSLSGNFGAGPGASTVTVPLSGITSKVPTPSMSLGVNPMLPGGTTTLTITLRNDSDITQTGIGFSLPAPVGTSFSSPTNTCGGGVAISGSLIFNSGTLAGGGATCAVTVNVTSAMVGMYTFSLGADTIFHTPGTGSDATSATLSVAASTPDIVVAPSMLGFASTVLGQQSPIQSVTITSAGTAALTLGAPTTTPASEFTIVNNTCPTVLPIGNTCGIDVRFLPQAAGARSGSLTINSDAPISALNVPLSGTALAGAILTASPMNFDFGDITVGALSATTTVTVTNVSVGSIALAGVTTSVPSEFEVVSSSCSTGLVSMGTCSVVLRFRPAAMGPRSANLNVAYGGAGSPLAIPLVGRGVVGALIQAMPTSVTFADTQVGMASATASFTLTNVAGAALSLSGITSSVPAEFEIVSTTCGTSLAAMGSCVVVTRFRPGASGARSASVSIAYAGAGSPLVLPLAGRGIVASLLQVMPMSVTFSDTPLGVGSALATISVANLSATAITISSVSASSPSVFLVAGNSCATLAAMASCSFTVQFRPDVVGAASASIAINYVGAGSPLQVPVSGVGLAGPLVSVAPTQLDFGPIELGGASGSRTVTVTNSGTTPVTIGSVAISPSVFRLGGGTCVLPSFSLAAQESCTLAVSFAPTTVGSATGALTVAAVAANASPAITVGLSGSGAAARLQVEKQFNPATVADTTRTRVVVVLRNLSSQALTQVQLQDSYPAGLTNVGAAPAINDCGLAVMMQTGGSGFAVTGGNLAANQTCTLEIGVVANTGQVVLPTAGVAIVNTLTNISATIAALANTNASLDSGSQLSASLTITSRARPVIRITPQPFPAFAETPVTQSSNSLTLTVANTGNDPLLFANAPQLAGTHAQDFAVVTNTCTGPLPAVTSGPVASCTITLQARPTAVGLRNATLSIASNDPLLPSVAVPLSVVAIPFAAVVELTPTSLDFGSQIVDTLSTTRTVTLANRGNRTLSNIRVNTANAGDFRVNNECGSTLLPAQECTIGVTFRPLALGGRNGEVVIVDDADGSPRRVRLLGSGAAAPRPVLAVAGGATFAPAIVGSAGEIREITLRNAGNAVMTLVDARPRTANFAIVTNGCASPVTPMGSCTLFVRFFPQQVGSIGDTLFIDAGEAGASSVALSGTGLEVPRPVLSLEPQRIAFADQIIGTRSGSEAIVVRNVGSVDMPIVNMVLSGEAAAEFASAPACPPVLRQGESCRVEVSFAPSVVGTRLASFVVTVEGAATASVSVRLEGIGAPVPTPRIEFSATQMSFGNTLTVGAALVPQSLTIRNAGGLPLLLSSIAPVGDFALTQGCASMTLAPGASCTVQVAFIPTLVGVSSGELRIVSNAPGSPHSVGLSGRGCQPFNIFGSRGVLSCGQ